LLFENLKVAAVFEDTVRWFFCSKKSISSFWRHRVTNGDPSIYHLQKVAAVFEDIVRTNGDPSIHCSVFGAPFVTGVA